MIPVVRVRDRRFIVEQVVVERRAVRPQAAGESLVAGPFRPRHTVLVEHDVGLPRADHLPSPDKRVVEVRALLYGEHTEDRTPRVANEVDLVLAESIPQATLRELFRVLKPGGRLRIRYESLAQYGREQSSELWLGDPGECPGRLAICRRHADRVRTTLRALVGSLHKGDPNCPKL